MTTHTPKSLFDRPIAHRGLHDRQSGVIENSASAFQTALDAGFAIECDLQLSADGAAIVFHDDTLDRLTRDRGRVHDRTASMLTSIPLSDSTAPDRPQRFSDLLRQVDGRTLLVVELKRQADRSANARLVAAALEAVAAYDGPLAFKSFDPDILIGLRRAGWAGPAGIVVYDYADDRSGLSGLRRFALRHLLHYPRTGFTFVSCEHTSLKLPAIRLFRALGWPVMSWTVRTQDVADAIAPLADQIVFEGFTPRT